MYRIPRHLHLERRRLTLAGALAFVAGYALYAHIPLTAFGLPLPVFTGLVYTVIVVLAASVTSYAFPRLRHLIDGVAVTRLAFATWVVVAHGQAIAASPALSATIVVGGAALLLRLGAWLDRLSQSRNTPPLLALITAQARTFTAWLDNAAARDGRPYPAAVASDARPIGRTTGLAAA
jgi:hypothetical protein